MRLSPGCVHDVIKASLCNRHVSLPACQPSVLDLLLSSLCCFGPCPHPPYFWSPSLLLTITLTAPLVCCILTDDLVMTWILPCSPGKNLLVSQPFTRKIPFSLLQLLFTDFGVPDDPGKGLAHLWNSRVHQILGPRGCGVERLYCFGWWSVGDSCRNGKSKGQSAACGGPKKSQTAAIHGLSARLEVITVSRGKERQTEEEST